MLHFPHSVNGMTTSTLTCPAPVGPARPPLVTPALLIRFVSMLGSATSFYLLLSVVPAYAGGSSAGLMTGALMLATVLGELATPRLVNRFGYRAVLAIGLFLLGAPALGLLASSSAACIVIVCFLRGLGFALAVVAGGAMTAALIPAERRGEGLAVAGIVAGVPAIVALPLGLWLVRHGGYPPVFIIAAAAALIAIVTVRWLPGRSAGGAETLGVLSGLREPGLLRPAFVFALSTMALGVFVTFLPLAVRAGGADVAAVALLVNSAASTLVRWRAGKHGDRHGPAALLIPGVVAAALGVLALALTSHPFAVLGGAIVFGAGFGVLQNASIASMYARVPASGYGTVSALWNFAYDAGLGVGAVAFGVLVTHTGYPIAFAATAVLVLAGLPVAIRDRRYLGPQPGHEA